MSRRSGSGAVRVALTVVAEAAWIVCVETLYPTPSIEKLAGEGVRVSVPETLLPVFVRIPLSVQAMTFDGGGVFGHGAVCVTVSVKGMLTVKSPLPPDMEIAEKVPMVVGPDVEALTAADVRPVKDMLLMLVGSVPNAPEVEKATDSELSGSDISSTAKAMPEAAA